MQHDFVLTENGGYSDRNQQVSWKDIVAWQEKMFFYSCYLYYVSDNPKLSDNDFDSIVRILENNYDVLSERIKHVCDKGKIKETAYLFAHDLTEQEIKEALEWRDK